MSIVNPKPEHEIDENWQFAVEIHGLGLTGETNLSNTLWIEFHKYSSDLYHTARAIPFRIALADTRNTELSEENYTEICTYQIL